MKTILQIDHLSKTYTGGKKAVNDLSLCVCEGDIYGFIGQNGAGKTTTLRAVTGILPFESGEITINGIDAQKFFNKKAIISKDSNTVSYRINNVSFKQTGKITILVKAHNTTREIHYNVVAQYAEKKAKNVILLIGDGMSLQAKQMARIT